MSKYRASRIASALVNMTLATQVDGVPSAALHRVLSIVRRTWLSLSDPIVEVTFCRRQLLMPLSHRLPFYARADPAYSLNLGRVYSSIKQKYGEVPIIDVGANIGDSVAVLTQHGSPPILCVEGEPTFLPLLEANVHSITPLPVIEPVFLGTHQGSTVLVAHGTARMLGDSANRGSSGHVDFAELLARHPDFESTRLLKVDTDGMDIVILRSALDWIGRQRPVLFFEYDPDLQRDHGGGGLDLLHNLFSLGYSIALVYDNKGDYMLTANLADQRLLEDLHAYFTGRRSLRYVDICAFHSTDRDVADELRLAEIAFFSALRAG